MHKYTNALAEETSPYLLQHAHNPVSWAPWSPEAFNRAKAEDKLVLVSIGYSACHWCHVMEHESFEDEEVAQIMNQRYICIKVDREERPDVDQVYMNAVQLMTGQGGWPLNCFTLPDQRPVYGGTYFRKNDWKSLLVNLDGFFRNRRDEAMEYAARLTAGVQATERLQMVKEQPSYGPQDLKNIFEPWSKLLDLREGGHARAPKFPLPNNFLFLMRYAHYLNDERADKSVRLTLDKMARGGIYDQLGGGFARYSVDAYWHVPHFEKMLYDNGQLVSLYAQAWQYAREPLYKQVVYDTIAFTEREMTSGEGGFYSALDADSEGVEGKFYVWTADQLASAWRTARGHVTALGSGREQEIFANYYDITEQGNWEGTNILRRLHSDEEVAERFDITVEELQHIIADGKAKLMAVRGKRVRPGLDDKILASWNGIMLKGLVDAYRAFGEKRFLRLALKNAGFIRDHLIRRSPEGEMSSMLRMYVSPGKRETPGFLDDYAFVADAFIALYEATFEETWLRQARDLADYAIRHFHNASGGMFYYTPDDGEALITRKYEIMDNVIPSSNSALAHVLYKLGLLYDEDRYSELCLQMLRNVKEDIKTYGSAYSNWAMILLEQVYGTYEVAITGSRAAEKRAELDRYYIPNKVTLGGETPESSGLPLLEGKFTGKTMIYVCRNKTCKLPVETIEAALEQLNIT